MKKFFAVFAIVTMISGAAFADCPADFNGDGNVGFADMTQLLSAWGPCDSCIMDLNGDGNVGFADMTQLLSTWGACPYDACSDVGGIDFMAAAGAPHPLGAGVIDGECVMIFGTGIPAGIELWANVTECDMNCQGCSSNDDCAADEYCEYAEFSCGDAGFGSCSLRAEVCAQIYDPVCTCDFTISSSLCHASAAGDAVMFLGECDQADVCTHHDGTWDADTQVCTCPAGMEYGYQRGCQAI